MMTLKLAAIVLSTAGTLVLAYGNFSPQMSGHEAAIHPGTLSTRNTEGVTVALLAGMAATAIGGFLLLVPARS